MSSTLVVAAIIIATAIVIAVTVTRSARRERLANAAILALATPPNAPSILFIGDSFTYKNHMPQIVASMFTTSLPRIGMVASTGDSLTKHWSDPTTRSTLTQGWNYVVLQDRSDEPLKDHKSFQTALVNFASAARAAGATPVLFETWAHRADDPGYAKWAEKTPAAMQVRLNRGFAAATAKAAPIRIAPVGTAWQMLDPSVRDSLLFEDIRHPSVAGSFLTAAVIYRAITEKPPTTRALPAGLSGATAAMLLASL